MCKRAGLVLVLACLTAQLTSGHVWRVIDGDTFVLYAVGVPAEERVRVLNIDTPERHQANYAEAREFTQSWLARGPFSITACRRDSFGRLLAVVDRPGDTLAHALTSAGFGKPVPAP